MESFENLVLRASNMEGTDFHLSAGIPPTVRVDGLVYHMSGEPCTPDGIKEVIYNIMTSNQIKSFEQDGEVDFAYTTSTGKRCRVNVFKQKGTCAMAARILNDIIPRPEELDIPKAIVDMCHKKSGLILITGPTGSGKSTTLASLIDLINRTYNYHIITMEDPIEYIHFHKKCIVNQREMGNDSKNYASSLRAALREDPDVILVGEMRDLETMSAAVTAAETGHLVFSTLHTIGAANTIDRIIDAFPPHQQPQIRIQLADVLLAVMSQRLVPKLGDKGRVTVTEAMVINPAIRNHIRDGKTFQIASSIQTGRNQGMHTMDDSLYEAYIRYDISKEDALAYAQDAAMLAKKMF